ncbi:MAG: hypothetical protein ACRERR_03365 [Moraxellaceae bacterium]
MRISAFVLPFLFSLFLTACGGSSDTAPATATAPQTVGLSWVDVQDGNGQTVVQHRYTKDSATDEEVVTTTQYQGYDGVWGTADDWRTARTRCRFQTASYVSPVGFGPDAFLGVSAALCTARHALAGMVRAEISGAYFTDELLNHFRPETATLDDINAISMLGWQPYLNAGDLITILADLNEAPVIANYSIEADASGLRLCGETCVLTKTEASLQISCGNLCGIAPSPVSDGLSISLGQNSCGSAMVQIYDGIRAQAMMSGGRLNKVVYSPALNNPFCYVQGYDQYRYDSNGVLIGTETYEGIGADMIWLSADDVRSSYIRLQSLSDGRLQVLYRGAGDDGVWETADDEIADWQRLTLSTRGRLLSVRKCTEPGTDLSWQTSDDVCQVLIFHYTDEH